MKAISARLTYANVISTLCLFLLLGGGAYAATQLPKNSVGAKQLQSGAVTPPKLSSAAKASLAGATGPVGPQGAAGAVGAQGPIGLQGAPGQRGPAGGGEFVVDASSGAVPVTTPVGSAVALSGDTAWTAVGGEVGVLLIQGAATLATNNEVGGAFEEFCEPFVEVFDNGRSVGGAFFKLASSETGAATPSLKISSPAALPLGLVNPGTSHSFTAKFGGSRIGGCKAGSTIEQVRLVVTPTGP